MTRADLRAIAATYSPWLRGNLVWLLAGRFVRSFSQAFLVIVFPLYIAAAGYSAAQLGELLTASSLGAIVAISAIGFLADRYGRRPMMIWIALLSAVGAGVYASTTQFWVLIVASAITCLGRGGGAGSGGAWGPFYPAEQALIGGSTAPEHRNAAFSALSFVTVLASAAGSAVAGVTALLHARLGLPYIETYRWLFWFAGAVGLLLVLFCLPLRETGPTAKTPPPRDKAAGNRGIAVLFGISPTSRRLIGRLWLTNGLTGLAWGVTGPFLTYWLYVRFGVGAATLGTLYTVINLTTAVPYLFASHLARRLGVVRAITVSRVVSVGFLLAMALAPTFLLAAVCYTLRMVVTSVAMPLRQSFVIGVADEHNRSAVAALSNLPSQLTSSISPSIGAYLMDAVSLASPYYMACVILLLNAWGYWAFFKDERPPEEAGAAPTA